jgi:hypothetical protein
MALVSRTSVLFDPISPGHHSLSRSRLSHLATAGRRHRTARSRRRKPVIGDAPSYGANVLAHQRVCYAAQTATAHSTSPPPGARLHVLIDPALPAHTSALALADPAVATSLLTNGIHLLPASVMLPSPYALAAGSAFCPGCRAAKTAEQIKEIEDRVSYWRTTCLKDWDAATHMTRKEWRTTCERGGSRAPQIPAREPDSLSLYKSLAAFEPGAVAAG